MRCQSHLQEDFAVGLLHSNSIFVSVARGNKLKVERAGFFCFVMVFILFISSFSGIGRYLRMEGRTGVWVGVAE